MIQGWVVLRPEHLMYEIENSLARLSISKKFFTLKTLTPIYPLYKAKYKDAKYYEDKEWLHTTEMKKEKIRNKSIDFIMKSFQ